MPEKAVIYARYSSDNQRDASIDQQVKACRAYAEQLGYDVLRVYDDRALTGKTDKRPSFLRMIRDSARRDFQYVIVYTLDRFSRNKYDSAIYKHKLKENGVRVLSAMEHITDDPTGMLMETILEGFAQYYSDELSQKINRGLTDNAEKGIVNGSVPLGYRRGPDGHAEIVPEEAELVREIFNRVATGEQLIAIANDLNARGLRTKKGAEFNKSSFNTILSNDRYIGVYRYKNIVHPDGFPPIIDASTFYLVQNKITTKKNPRENDMRRKTQYGTYLLTGKLFCGKCGSHMTGICGVGNSGTRCFYYSCVGKKRDHSCDRKNIRRDPVESAITGCLRSMLMDDDLLLWMADLTIAYQDEENGRDDLTMKTAELKNVTDRISNIMEAIEKGILTATTKARLEELEEKARQLKAEIAACQRADEIKITKDMLISYLEGIRDGDIDNPEFQQLLIDSFLAKATVYDDHIQVLFSLTKDKKEASIPLDPNLIASEADAPTYPVGEGVCLRLHGGDDQSLNKPINIIFVSGLFFVKLPFAG